MLRYVPSKNAKRAVDVGVVDTSGGLSLSEKKRRTQREIERLQSEESPEKKAKRRRAMEMIAKRKKAAEAAARDGMEIETNVPGY